MRSAFLTSGPDPSEFARTGYLRIRISVEVVALVEDIVERARGFFRLAKSLKRQASLAGVHEGWQAFGGEFSITPDRPDLHESFWLTRGRLEQAAEQYSGGAAYELHAKMLEYLDIVQEIEALVIAETLVWLGLEGIHTAQHAKSMESDLQVLYYQPARQRRDLLQDPHEDSLSLTFTWSDCPGLEILGQDGLFHPVRLALDEVAVLPGEIFAVMTGFKVQPQVHRVARHASQAERLTLSYFSSPDIVPGERIEPWVSCRENKTISLAERICSNRQKYLVK
jgi:isopenicillin N synthase-like dioxygenase